MNPRPDPAAVVDMANRQVCKKSYPDFEWSIPDANSVFSSNRYSPIKGPTHKFCHGNWELDIHKNELIDSLNIHLSEEVQRQHVRDCNSHEIFISLTVFKVKQNGEKSPLHVSLLKSKDMKVLQNLLSDKTRYEYIAYHAVILDKLKQTDTLRIICNFRCMDCPVTLAYITIPSDNGFPSLKRKHPDDELVEFDGSKKKLRPSGDDKLLNYIKTLLSSGLHSDVTIKVGDREFNAHRFVLCATSEVFDKMFSHPMLESQTGEINIDDCSPDAFQKFLEFAYSGELDVASHDVVFDLYHIAEKYGVQEVLKICSNFIAEHLSVETFVESFSFAELHQDSTILEEAFKFFIKNLKQITPTDEWKSYVQKHAVSASELLLRVIDHGAHARTKN